MPKRNPSLGQIVRCHLDIHLVADEDADAVLAHLARSVREHIVAVFQLHPEHRVGQKLGHGAFELEKFFFGHC